MKLISLNTWGGKYFEPLIKFIKQHSEDTGIFCFQEMSDTKSGIKMRGDYRANLLSEIKEILSNLQIYYFPAVTGFDFDANPVVGYDLTFGQAVLVNKNTIVVDSQENYFITKDENFQILQKDFSNLPTPLQYVSFTSYTKTYHLFNFHGTPMPPDKLDTNGRLTEAQKVRKIIDSKTGPKILVGDFNLLPQTQCIKIYEKEMKNLIKEFNIQITRSNLSPFSGKPDFQKFADYTFVSNDVEVKSFEVPKVEISDHLPMILEFS